MEIILTNELIAKLYVPYLGATIRGNGKEYRLTLNKTTNRHDIDLSFVCDQRNYFPVLRPLISITDEEAIEIAKIVYPKENIAWTSYYGRFYFEYVFCNESKGWMKSQIYQFLQSKGFDLPNYLLGGKTLKESGLAIYEN